MATTPATATAGTVPPPDVAWFDPRAVPCTPRALASVRERLLWRARARRPEDVAVLQALATELAELGADDMHRRLLTARRELRRAHPWLEHDAAEALAGVRPHSRLYSRRTCACLSDAWDGFRRDLDARLAGTAGTWAVASGDQVFADVTSPLSTGELSRYLGLGVRPPTQRLQLTAGDGRVEVSLGRRSWTFTRLADRLARAAGLIRWAESGELRAAASWVLTWPDGLADVIVVLSGSYQLQFLAGSAKALLACGFADLDEVGRQAVTGLAAGWTGPILDLVPTAAAVADR